MPKYIILEKEVGQTPLQVLETYKLIHPEFADVSMAYAGRLDPMASGKLLVLIGEECKKQEEYHSLDKSYRFEVLLGSSSDTADVLGLVDWKEEVKVEEVQLRRASQDLLGPLSLPYPKFSSRTVKGKPLHTWTLEDRLGEIEIPTANTTIHQLRLLNLRTEKVEDVYDDAINRINSIAPVTEESKALGRDFRRDDVRVAWQVWKEHHKGKEVQIATFQCLASSGTYMRSLSEEIAKRVGIAGLAYSIHRDIIGSYQPLPFGFGFWKKRYR